MPISIDLRKNIFPDIARSLPGNIATLNTKAAYDCMSVADPPVDTGNLKGGVEVIEGTASNPAAYTNWHAPYATFIERGTYRMAAQPFAEPAADAVKGGWVMAMAVVVERGYL